MNSDMDKFFKEAEEWAIKNKIVGPLAETHGKEIDAIMQEIMTLGSVLKKCADDLENIKNAVETNNK